MAVPDPLSPFAALSQALSFADDHQRAWWSKTGGMLARVIASANYSPDDQFEYLRFYAQTIVPRLGPYPQTFRSSMTRSGLPLEFSINYQQYGKAPVVRVGFEPLSELSGSDTDPFNKIPAGELVAALAKQNLAGFDTQLWDQAIKHHTVNETEEASIEGMDLDGGYIRSQTTFGFDFVGAGNLSVKGYTFPALKSQVTGIPMAQLMAESVKSMEPLVDCSAAFSMVHAYLTDTAYDDKSFFSLDFVAPSKSRLKVYTGSNGVTLNKLEEVWTLGGRLQTPTVLKGLEYLKQVFRLLKIEEGERTVEVAFDDRKNSSKTTPLLWNYEMRPGDPNPLTKIYFPIHGENDMQIITGLAQFFRAIGLVDLGNSYVDVVKSYYPDIDLANTDRFTSWLSFAYTEKTGVYLSTYYHSSLDNPWDVGKQ
ncbi:hypothetical protein LOZ65_003666 [Ophidiomyces ophidiicola]|nr:hypothetical protein LOZ65_003666 [Ophidiomyces ophidiicola]